MPFVHIRRHILAALVVGGIGSFFCTASQAEPHTTAFGFTVDLPDSWIQLSRQTLEENYPGENLASLGVAGSFSDAEAADRALAGISDGRFHYFFDRQGAGNEFADFVNLQLVPRSSVQFGDVETRLCQQVETDLPEFLEASLEIRDCTYESSEELPYLSYQYAVEGEGITRLQTEYYLTDNVVLLMSGAHAGENGLSYSEVLERFNISVSNFFAGYPQKMQLAVAAYAAQEYASAHELLLPLADYGDLDAEYRLGVLYDNGLGVEQDLLLAADYYQRSAVKGNFLAATNLGSMYLDGRGVDANLDTAVGLYATAAAAGVAEAQRTYAALLMEGRGIEQDTSAALNWFMQAAQQGDRESGSFLEALYTREAEAGNNEAWRMLAALYLRGAGVSTDIALGLELLERSARGGSDAARELMMLIYSQGRYGVEIDQETVEYWREFSN